MNVPALFPVFMVFLFFVLMLILPFLPGIFEILRPKDGERLFINMDYLKNPRYFDRAFKNLMKGVLEKTGTEPGIRQVTLSKSEILEVCNEMEVKEGERLNHIVYVKGDFRTDRDVILEKEIYAVNRADIGERNIVRAIACDGNVSIADGTRIIRWIGSEKDIKIGSGCSLGVLCACEGKFEINKGCTFKALYGNPVRTHGTKNDFEIVGFMYDSSKKNIVSPVTGEIKTIEDVVLYSTDERLVIPPGSSVNRNIIVKNDLFVGQGCKILGSVKAYGDILMEDDILIEGSVFAEGRITVGQNCLIIGNLFSQDVIILNENVCIGRKDTVKSVIGKKGVEMNADNIVFGYILTEGVGRIL